MAEMVAEEAEQEMIARWLEEAPVVLGALPCSLWTPAESPSAGGICTYL